MGLKADLKAAILANINAQYAKDTGGAEAREDYSERLADDIADAVATAINGTTVTFALTAPNGPVAGTITLSNNIT